MDELIIVRQLPVIEEHLRNLSQQIDARVNEAAALVCTEETVKSVKKARAELNAQFDSLEEQRKAVQKAVTAPYDEFKRVYDQCVTDKFRSADAILKGKINAVENELKQQKTMAVSAWFDEYAASLQIDWVKFEDAGISITLSTSVKALRTAAKEYLDRMAEDLALIETYPIHEEILVEYRRLRSAAQAIRAVQERHTAIEDQREADAVRAEARAAEQAAVEKIRALAPAVEAAPEEADPVLTLRFTVTAPRSRLRALKRFLTDGGYTFK